MSDTKITLSKLKSMSGADIVARIEAGALSVEINGSVAFDIVRPVNALDEKFMKISAYIAGEVAAELQRAAETKSAEALETPAVADAAVEAIAKTLADSPAAPKPTPKPKAVKKKKPVKKPVPKKKAAVAPAAVSMDVAAFPENTPDFTDVDLADQPPADALFEDLLKEELNLDSEDNLIGEDSQAPVAAETYFDSESALVAEPQKRALPDLDDLDDMFADETPLIRSALRQEPKNPVSNDPFDDEDDMPMIRRVSRK